MANKATCSTLAIGKGYLGTVLSVNWKRSVDCAGESAPLWLPGPSSIPARGGRSWGDRVLTFALLAGFDGGLRRDEISEARVSWFDLETKVLDVSNYGDFVTKDRDKRVIPLTDRFVDFLKSYLADRDKTEYVLAPEKIEKGSNRYRYDVSKRVRAHFKRCKVKCSIHDMRRSFASNRVSAGISVYKVARWLGDGIVVVERSYGHLAPQDAEINKGV